MNDVDNKRSSAGSTTIFEEPSCHSPVDCFVCACLACWLACLGRVGRRGDRGGGLRTGTVPCSGCVTERPAGREVCDEDDGIFCEVAVGVWGRGGGVGRGGAPGDGTRKCFLLGVTGGVKVKWLRAGEADPNSERIGVSGISVGGGGKFDKDVATLMPDALVPIDEVCRWP